MKLSKAGLLCLVTLTKAKRKQLDDIEWEDPGDPRIEALLAEIKNYEDRIAKGELYEPNF